MSHLNDGQIERLSKLFEECAETVQIASKVLRFGFETEYNGATNLQRLEEEVGDILLAIQMMVDAGDITREGIEKYIPAKKEKLNRYLKYNQIK
jgi:NTP pyrophosphatase (non-canonical NTP hydrolase)